jgi:hypothetical protein
MLLLWNQLLSSVGMGGILSPWDRGVGSMHQRYEFEAAIEIYILRHIYHAFSRATAEIITERD